MIIPRHIRQMAQQAEIELIQELEKRENPLAEIALKDIKNIRYQLQNKRGEIFANKEDSFMNLLFIVEAIIQACQPLPAPACERIFRKVEIEPELEFALNYASMIHPRMKKELNQVMGFLERVPNEFWSWKDESAYYRVFKFVNTKSKWEKIMKINSGVDLAPNYKHVKIGVVISETSYWNGGIVEKVRDRLNDKFGKAFSVYNDEFDKLFMLGTTATYYIYVPQ